MSKLIAEQTQKYPQFDFGWVSTWDRYTADGKYPRPATDTLPSQAFQQLSSSWEDLNSQRASQSPKVGYGLQ